MIITRCDLCDVRLYPGEGMVIKFVDSIFKRLRLKSFLHIGPRDESPFRSEFQICYMCWEKLNLLLRERPHAINELRDVLRTITLPRQEGGRRATAYDILNAADVPAQPRVVQENEGWVTRRTQIAADAPEER